VEGNETVNLQLNTLVDGSASQVSLTGPTAHTLTITDNDTATVSLASASGTVGEATASQNVGVSLVITGNGVVGTGTLERNVSVNVQDLLNGTATGGGSDYSLSASGTVTFNAGESGSTKDVAVTIIDDTRVEGTETVSFGLGTLVDGTNGQVSI